MAERRIVTALFCDVVGSTGLASQFDDPEDWAEIINAAFPCLIRPVERYGGHVARLLGDAILAFFGAPSAHEDDAQRAILAALGILDEIQPFREEIEQTYGLDFNVRVGLNTGPVIFGAFGTQTAFEYTAMGDAVNIAAKMQQTAQPGTIQVAWPTYRLAAADFSFEPLGRIAVKGKDEPVAAYRVTGRAPAPGHRRRPDFGAPTVGRERELAALREALLSAQAGTGRIAAIVGEAGLGKSRLIEELRDDASRGDEVPPAVWIEESFLPFEASIPYALPRKFIAGRLGLSESDGLDAIREHLVQQPGFSDQDSRERAARAIDLLFHHSPEGAGALDSSPAPVEGFRQELTAIVERLLREQVERSGSGIFVIDDLHFVDPASIELLASLLPRLANLPLLVLIALRPDTLNPAWALHGQLASALPAHYQTLTLTPLEDWQAGALVDELTAGASLSPAFRRAMLDRVDGNPLFAEEIVRSLIERELIVRRHPEEGPSWQVAANVDLESIAIPDTLQLLIQERMDRLEPDTRDALQIAAVIGQSFGHDEIAAVLDDDPALEKHLEILQRAMFIRVAPQIIGREYHFNHALTRDAVYQTILRRRRPELHLQVGNALEALHAGMVEEYAGLLSIHFAEARDPRAVQFAVMAGDRALALYAPSEASGYYSRAIDAARQLNLDLPTPVLRRRGQAYETLGQFDRAREDIEGALERARLAGDLRETWQAHMLLGQLWAGRDYAHSAEHFARARELARELDDSLLLAHSLNREGNLKVNHGQLTEALDLHTEALDIFQASNDVPGMAETYDLLGMAAWQGNDLTASADNYERAVVLQRQIDDRLGLVSSLTMLSAQGGELDIDSLDRGADTIEAGRRAGEEALAVAREIGWRSGESFALFMLGKGAGARGEYSRAFELARSSLTIAEETEHRQWMTAANSLIGHLYLDLLSAEDALRYLDAAHGLAGQINSIWWLQRVASQLALALLLVDEIDRAHAVLDEAFPAGGPARTLGQSLITTARIELALARAAASEADRLLGRLDCPGDALNPQVVALRGRTQAALGNFEEAERTFVPLIERLRIKRLRPLQWRVEARLGEVYAATGRGQQAGACAAAARSTVAEIARDVPDQTVKATFTEQAARLISEGIVAGSE